MDFEIKLIEFLQAGRTPFFDNAFQVISAIGSVVGAISVCVLFLIFKRKVLFWYLFSYGFVYLVVETLKHFVERVRPFNVTETIANIGDSVNSFSFPSGHVACATAIAIFMGYFLFCYFKKKSFRIGIVLSCCLYVGLVALSRMYLGKHFLTDVVAGAVISAVICVVSLVFMHYVQKGKRMEKNENKNGNKQS